MRMRKKSWADAELAASEAIVREYQSYKGRWCEYFGNGNDIHLEIGCGKGRFLAGTAAADDGVNFIGLERQSKVFAMAVRALRESGAVAALINADVVELESIFAPGEIKRIYINFCDPWPKKKKWAKRRLTHAGFLDKYSALMGSDGEIHFKTDNRELFEFSIEQFSLKGWVLKNVSLDLHNADNAGKPFYDENITTEYEEKFMCKGPIYRLEAYIGG